MAGGSKQVVFLSGPIGAGKSTVGAALAQRLGCAFLESDALSDPAMEWHEPVEAVNVAIVERTAVALAIADAVIVELPLDEARWLTIRAAFGPEVRVRCITLAASYDSITAAERGRVFESWEMQRIKEMIAEGYNTRAFSEAIVRTDAGDLSDAVGAVAALVAGHAS